MLYLWYNVTGIQNGDIINIEYKLWSTQKTYFLGYDIHNNPDNFDLSQPIHIVYGIMIIMILY